MSSEKMNRATRHVKTAVGATICGTGLLAMLSGLAQGYAG